jgi:hypothetical protein
MSKSLNLAKKTMPIGHRISSRVMYCLDEEEAEAFQATLAALIMPGCSSDVNRQQKIVKSAIIGSQKSRTGRKR